MMDARIQFQFFIFGGTVDSSLHGFCPSCAYCRVYYRLMQSGCSFCAVELWLFGSSFIGPDFFLVPAFFLVSLGLLSGCCAFPSYIFVSPVFVYSSVLINKRPQERYTIGQPRRPLRIEWDCAVSRKFNNHRQREEPANSFPSKKYDASSQLISPPRSRLKQIYLGDEEPPIPNLQHKLLSGRMMLKHNFTEKEPGTPD